jgi:hypothetical protein
MFKAPLNHVKVMGSLAEILKYLAVKYAKSFWNRKLKNNVNFF